MFQTNSKRLESLKNQIVSFIREYVQGSGHKKGIIGLSGGVDSSLVYLLTCEALGVKNCIAVMMPYKTTRSESVKNAEKLIKQKGGIKRYYNISDVVDQFITLFGDISRIRLGNIQARTRMITLYNVASETGGLVMGTGNKTELLLGYFTLYGDGGCSIEPLGDLYKTEVWELASWIGIPDEIVSKKPSAELWENQTDESELGITYQTADAILYLLIENNHSPDEIETKGYKRQDIDKIIELVRKSRFKRHSPPAPVLRQYNFQEFL